MGNLTKELLIDNRYRLAEKLGEDALSETWAARDEMSQKYVAIKFYQPLSPADVDDFHRYFTEICDLHHTHVLAPRVVSVYDGRPITITRFCRNGTLARAAGHIVDDDFWRFIHEIASAIEYIHTRRPPVIHHDIKPTNLLIDDDGSFAISDFGVSPRLYALMMQNTVNAQAVNDAYTPPECVGKYDGAVKASDIWAFGATLYTIAAGQPPFGTSGGAAQITGTPVPSLNPGWSREINSLIAQCLSQSPWERPTARQIKETAAAHLPGATVAAPSPAPTHAPAVSIPVSSTSPSSTYGDSTSAFNAPRPFSPPPAPAPTPIPNNPMPTYRAPERVQAPASRPWEDDGSIAREPMRPIRFEDDRNSLNRESFSSRRRRQKPKSGLERFIESIEKYKVLFILLAIILLGAIVAVLVIRGNKTATVSPEDVEDVTEVDLPAETDVPGLAEEVQPSDESDREPADTKHPVNPGGKAPGKPAVGGKNTNDKNVDEKAPRGSAEPTKNEVADKSNGTNDKSTPDKNNGKSQSKGGNSGKLSDALANQDYATVRALADGGDAKASGELAQYLLKNRQYEEADRYGQRAKAGGDANGTKVVNALDKMGYYDDK